MVKVAILGYGTVGGGVLEAILALTGALRETGIRHTGGEGEEDHV